MMATSNWTDEVLISPKKSEIDEPAITGKQKRRRNRNQRRKNKEVAKTEEVEVNAPSAKKEADVSTKSYTGTAAHAKLNDTTSSKSVEEDAKCLSVSLEAVTLSSDGLPNGSSSECVISSTPKRSNRRDGAKSACKKNSKQKQIGQEEAGKSESAGSETTSSVTPLTGPPVHKQFRGSEPKIDSFRYWDRKRVEEALELGTVIKGPLRINPKNYRQCFIPYTNNYIDVYIPWRNRALNGDIVAVHLLKPDFSRVLVEDIERYMLVHAIEGDINGSSQLNTSVNGNGRGTSSHLEYARCRKFMEDNPELVKVLQQMFSLDSGLPYKFLQPVGVVVDVLEMKHNRLAAGSLEKRKDNNKFALLVPNDSRLPRIDIPIQSCPKDFLKRSEDYAETIYVAKISMWKEGNARANGSIVKALGSRKEIEPMTSAVLMEHGVDTDPFSDKVNSCLPQAPWTIPARELEYRKDFTKECIFTIDPSTARDLDDALHCRQLDSETYEIGVHIADVSYFIELGSALDSAAACRATSVYMVQKVIPMLPRLLCEQLCSLNPDEERLAFSVVWHISKEGDVTSEWFGRSIIKSCAKLSYQHAQGFIEEPERDWQESELPGISEGFTVGDIKSRVLALHQIAKVLRKRRFDRGALRLDQTKLGYALDPDTGYPTGYFIYQLKDSNRLVEEYMLLANMAVARQIYKSFPERAVLRRHAEPQGKQLSDLETACQNMGLSVDTTSSQTLQESLSKYVGGESEEKAGKFQILMQMCTKPMQKAEYFCTGSLEDEALYKHYALCVPFYTHFTSPIRRYADVMVHRLLAASLGYTQVPAIDSKYVEAQAKHCNEKKNNAKGAGDLSLEMFFVAALKAGGPVMEKAMVMTVLDKAVDIVCIKLGHKKRIYTDKLQLLCAPQYNNQGFLPNLTLTWPSLDPRSKDATTQTLRTFDIVRCQLSPGKDILQCEATLVHPDYPSSDGEDNS